jgi:hypothetical protein
MVAKIIECIDIVEALPGMYEQDKMMLVIAASVRSFYGWAMGRVHTPGRAGH